MSKSSSSIKKTIKLRIFNILYSLICKSQESSFRQLEYKSFSFRILAYFAGEDLQNKVVWFKAAENGDTKRISQIYDSFENKADIDIMDEQGHTALHIATIYKHIDTVKILIRAGANINTQDKNNNIPSKLDLEKKNEAAISLLKEPVDNPNNPDIVSQDKAQTLAKDEHVNAELKESLGSKTQVSRPEDLKRLDANFRTAISKGNFEEAEILLKSGADVNSKTANSETALHIVVRSGNLERVMKLLGFGADILSKGQDGCTVLHIAVFRKDITMIENLVGLKRELLEIKQDHGFTALRIAVFFGNPNVVQKLIDLKANLNATDSSKIPVFHQVISHGRLDMIKQFLEAGVDLEMQDETEKTALHIASSKGSLEVVKELLYHVSKLKDVKKFLEAKDKYGKTALHLAVFGKHFETAKELIKLGAGLDVKDERDIKILEEAPEKGLIDLTSLLEEAVNDRNNSDIMSRDKAQILVNDEHFNAALKEFLGGKTQADRSEYLKRLDANFHTAISEGDFEEAKRLLESGADVNCKDVNNKTALHIAVRNGNFERVMKLVDLGADIFSKDQDGSTVLHIAVFGEDITMIENLVKFKRELLEIKAEYGQTALCAAISVENPKVIQKLIDLKADLSATNSSKTPILHYAISLGRLDTIKQFLEAGADLEIKNEEEETTLHLASSKGSLEVVKELLHYAKKLKDVKKFLETKDKYGKTALHIASSKERMDVVEQLRGSGADLEAKDDRGYTVLHVAASNGKTEIVSKLKKLGANLEAKDDQDNTALHLAVIGKHFETIKELIELGARLDVKNKLNNTPLSIAKHLKTDDIISLLEKADDQEKQLMTEQNLASLTSPSNSLRLGSSQDSAEIQ